MNETITMVMDFGTMVAGGIYITSGLSQAGAHVPCADGTTIFVPAGFYQVNPSTAPHLPSQDTGATVEDTGTTVQDTGTTVEEPGTPDDTIKSGTMAPTMTEKERAALQDMVDKAKANVTKKDDPPAAPTPTTQEAPKQAPVEEEGEKGVDVPETPPAQIEAPKQETTAPSTTPALAAPSGIKISDLAYNWSGKYPDVEVKAYNKAQWSELGQRLIPQVNPNFKWSEDILFAMWWAQETKSNLFLAGSPGTGKTEACKQWAALVNQPYVFFNGKGDMEGYHFLGMSYAEPGGMVWRDGMYTAAMREGWFVGIHEVFKIPATILMNLQSSFEKDGRLVLDEYPGSPEDRVVKRDERAMVVCTDNTKGLGDNLHKFAAGQVQDTSFIDRMGMVIDVDYLPNHIEIDLLTAATGISNEIATQLVEMATRVRLMEKSEEVTLSVSIRGLFEIANMISKAGVELKAAIELCVLNKYADDTEIGAIQGIISTMFV